LWHHNFHVACGFGGQSAAIVCGTILALLSSQNKQGTVSANDQRLIVECLKGNPNAFGELVRCYQDRLYHTVVRLVDNAEDAQDVVQEVFLSAYQSLDAFKGDSQLFTWLYRIAVNAAISYRRKRRMVLSLDVVRNGDPGLEPFDRSEHSRPGYALEQSEQGQRLWLALSRLSSEHRAVLVLKDMEGQKYETIAELLRVPIGTIRSRLHRARLELRDLLAQDE
jgi:RNA polymerase sigma-70 factor (ECF subfamily)